MWARNGNLAGNKMSWQKAMKLVEHLVYEGYSDWRLPTKEELEIFAKQGDSSPSEWFNAHGFSNVQANWYWSSSAYVGFTFLSSYAWYVAMGSGGVGYGNQEYGSYGYVWPVRSGR
jgi:formylglycine-generating enzyme required for sulfatase activity